MEEVKKSALLLILLLFLSIFVTSFIVFTPLFSVEKVNATEEGSWTTLSPLPMPFYSTLGVAVVDGKIYHIGSDSYMKYDPERNTWTDIVPLPIYDDWSTVVTCQNKIYVIGGQREIPTQVYDPATDTWENRTSIPTTRIWPGANVVDGKIYVIGGQIPSPLGVINPSSANDVYDPATDSWSQMAPIPIPVEGYASAVLDDKIYIISGGTFLFGTTYDPINYVQIFDPETNQWTNGTSIPTGVAYAGACVTTGTSAPKRIYVIGGTQNLYFRYVFSHPLGLNQIYDPETDAWTTGTPMPTPRAKMGIAVINDEIYTIGGQISNDWGGVTSTNEKYTPAGYIPEFPSWTPLLIGLVAVIAVAVIYRRKLHEQRHRRSRQ
jgi:N-acetylneuraminic acid mutarotase